MHWLIRLLERLGNGSLRFGRRLSAGGARLTRQHFAHNAKLTFNGFIEEQMRGAASEIRMGGSPLERPVRWLQKLGLLKRAFRPGYNACGWIAVYNALLTLNRPVHPAQIVQTLEQQRGLNADGLFGTDPRIFAAVMTRFGCRTEAYFERSAALDAKLKAAGTGILCAVNPGGITHGAHNINMTWDADAGAYRLHNAGLRGTYKTLDALLDENKMRMLSLTVADI